MSDHRLPYRSSDVQFRFSTISRAGPDQASHRDRPRQEPGTEDSTRRRLTSDRGRSRMISTVRMIVRARRPGLCWSVNNA